MDFTAASSSSRLSREGEEEEGEEQEMEEEEEGDEPSPREISFMPPAASPPSVSPSAAAASASASASGSPFRSSDGAGASGSGGGAGPDVDAEPIDKEHMFDKVVTPSDVGKLNRLVIPKQHAEKYFPLDAAANDKGLLLSFEDRGGKLWRFRYSYWNSSQSYVMTKGWSRFVKEKRLDAGDTVSFSRGAADAARDRLFIDWKRRADPHARLARMPMPMPNASPYGPWGAGPGGFYMPSAPPATLYEHHRLRQGFDFRSSINAAAATGPARPQVLYFGSPGLPPQHTHMPPPPQPQHPHPLHIAVQQQPSPAVTLGVPMVLDSVPIASSPTAASKRVRLFGVNLDNPQPYAHGGESSQQDANALSLRMPGWQRPAPYRLHEPPHHAPAGAESSAASSPSSSSSSKREAHSSLDLDL
ncbi:hypothetical protein QYE76_045805 [Lolium multiflorum]|uniref:TF-B3 domain-containing protein n=1 Tax=Lolium multiflorum TaxID=4521 RepID=A0AAD8TNH6_LOLMU|nr:hypothetical protein QYE76_045805 [Lolium multiflorum]